MSSVALAPPPTAADPLGGQAGADFTIDQSPFDAAEALILQQAVAAAMQPVAEPVSPAGQQGLAAKRARSAGDASPASAPTHRQQQFASKQRPPRPPVIPDSGSLVLDVSLVARQGSGSGSPPGSARSPRGGAASPGGRRQMSKTIGRVCIECCTSTTTQWRSQGLLCNSCGVKLIKGRLPMDPESMHRRYQRLPPAIREHPMWAAAQAVAQAQSLAAAAAAAGQPWACPGCDKQGGQQVAGPCGLHYCPDCVDRYQVAAPTGGAAAVAATVAAPAPCLSPVPTAAPGHKRRKQATPRSAATGSLSPVSASSSGGSSIQAYSWQCTAEEGQDDASSKELSPSGRPASRRLQERQRQLQEQNGLPPLQRLATPPSTPASAKTPPPSTGLARMHALAQAQHAASATPTAAEAAAALLVLTESDELRMEAVMQLDRLDSCATGAACAAAAFGQAARHIPAAPQQEAAADPGNGPAAAAAAPALDVMHQLPAECPPIAPEPAASLLQQQPAPVAAVVDSVQLYPLLIGAAATSEAAAAGLSHELVGRYLAALTTATQRQAAASAEVTAAIRAQRDQQAHLVASMTADRQFLAAVALMRSVVQLAGWAD